MYSEWIDACDAVAKEPDALGRPGAGRLGDIDHGGRSQTGGGEMADFVEDDEDAEEQAQILFYTARERAVSRDRMLRQVGLAKALVNFSE